MDHGKISDGLERSVSVDKIITFNETPVAATGQTYTISEDDFKRINIISGPNIFLSACNYTINLQL